MFPHEEEKQSLSDNDMLREQDASISESSKDFEFSSSSENRFFADSPYYDAFVEKEIHSAEMLCTAFNDISNETDSFSRASQMLLKSLNCLSLSFRNCSNNVQKGKDKTRAELIPEVDMLIALGETLEEISVANKTMFDMIETYLGYHLTELSVKQMDVINKLKKEKEEADVQTTQSEQEIRSYLNGKNAANNFDNCTDHSQCQETRFCAVPYPMSYCIRTERRTERCTERRTERRLSDDSFSQRTSRTGDTSRKVQWSQKIRIEETAAELKRFQLTKNIVNANYERRRGFNQSNGEFLMAMHKCFQTCLDKVAKIVPKVDKDERKCLDYQKDKKPLWEEREMLLVRTLSTMKRAGEVSMSHGNAETELTEIERDAHLWDLPDKLATVSKFRRPSPPDVLMEGWLYQKCSSIMSLQSSWVRRWFILKSNGIYYLESKVEGRRSGKSNLKVKLFDVAICTVRELPDKPAARFCFELIDASNKPIILQARGPNELQIWLDRIRSAVGFELAKPNPQVGKGTKFPRRSSEIMTTVIDKKSWHVWDRSNRSNTSQRSNTITGSGTDFFGDIQSPLIVQVLEANPACADCGADSPDWVSLNLGILVCLECSGVHRSLGCHVSKVRSLMLDTLSNSEASLLLSLGNDCVNKIWEKDMQPGSKALKEVACGQDYAIREDWIKRKYVRKEFIGSRGNMNAEYEEKLSRELYAASERGDVVGVATALAHGANLNWKNNEAEDGPCTALEISIMRRDAGKGGAVECAELLLQNGLKVVKDDDSIGEEERDFLATMINDDSTRVVSAHDDSSRVVSVSSNGLQLKRISPSMARLLEKVVKRSSITESIEKENKMKQSCYEATVPNWIHLSVPSVVNKSKLT